MGYSTSEPLLTDETVEAKKMLLTNDAAKVTETATEHDTITMTGAEEVKPAEVKTQERTETTPGENHNSLPNVTIIQRYGRTDRLGANMRRPIFLMAYAHCNGYNFCILQEGQKFPQMWADAFAFPICSSNVVEQASAGILGITPVNASGVYHFVDRDNWLVKTVKSSKLAKCAFKKPFRDILRKMILESTNRGEFKGSTVANEELFTNKEVTTVAVHVRRGDITREDRNDIFMPDELFVATIAKVRDMMLKAGRSSEVHLFSEDYGTVNWTAYDGLVDHFHLAPQLNPATRGDKMDMHLNVRDWKHFVKADILVAGGSFSHLPGYSRPDPDKATGLPLTLTFCVTGYWRHYDYHNCDDFPFKYSKVAYDRAAGSPWDIEFRGLPDVLKNLMDTNTTDDHALTLTLPTAKSTDVSKLPVLPYMESPKERLSIKRIHSLAGTPPGKKYVISYGLYGISPKYLTGAIKNAELAKTYFPGWVCRFYVDPSLSPDVINKLKEHGAEVVYPPPELQNGTIAGMFWRFLVADDLTVDRFIVRDSDSRLNARDRFAVEEWINSGRSVHVVRDHTAQLYAMNGCCWGGVKGSLKNVTMMELMSAHIDAGKDFNGYGKDVVFLLKIVWPMIKDDQISHDAYHCKRFPNAFPFPTQRDDNYQHIGQVFDANDAPKMRHIHLIRNVSNPVECRPKEHQDWIFG